MEQSPIQSATRHPIGDSAYQIGIILAALLLLASVSLL
jgi:hypothetical protein